MPDNLFFIDDSSDLGVRQRMKDPIPKMQITDFEAKGISAPGRHLAYATPPAGGLRLSKYIIFVPTVSLSRQDAL